MTEPLRDKSAPLADRDRTFLPPVTGPYIRCEECLHRAYLVPEWRPSWGIDALLKKFTCPHGHNTFRVFTRSDLDLLTRRTT